MVEMPSSYSAGTDIGGNSGNQLDRIWFYEESLKHMY
jgi:hypothetical protein